MSGYMVDYRPDIVMRCSYSQKSYNILTGNVNDTPTGTHSPSDLYICRFYKFKHLLTFPAYGCYTKNRKKKGKEWK